MLSYGRIPISECSSDAIQDHCLADTTVLVVAVKTHGWRLK